MTTLHFVFGPHFRGKGAHLLWQKMYDIHQQAHGSPVVIALENIGQSEADSRLHEEVIARTADQFSQIPKRPYGLADLESRLEQTARKSQKTLNDIGFKMDQLGVEMIAQIFNKPVRYIESHDTKGVKESPRDLPLKTFVGMPTIEYLKQIRDNYDAYTQDNVARHDVVAENLATLIRERKLHAGGHVVVFFGYEHLGMEKHLKEYLKTQGIEAEVKKPVLAGVQRTLWDDLVSKRYEKPEFSPTDEELSRSHLHHLICHGFRKLLAQELAREDGEEFNSDNSIHYTYHAEKLPEYSDFVNHSKKILEKSPTEQVHRHLETYISDGLDIEPFMKPEKKRGKK